MHSLRQAATACHHLLAGRTIQFASCLRFNISVRFCLSAPTTSTLPTQSAICEQQVNQQINNELVASQSYLALGLHFAATNLQLLGCASFFLLQADEERSHAAILMRYQGMRGGRVNIGPLVEPDIQLTCECASLEQAFEAALALEGHNLRSLLELHRVASVEQDELLAGLVSGNFLPEQMEEIAKLTGMLNRVRMAGNGNPSLGAFLIDQEMSAKYKYSGPLARILGENEQSLKH